MKRQISILIYVGIFIPLVIVGLYRCSEFSPVQPDAPVPAVESSLSQQQDTARIRLNVTPYRSLSNPQK